jgi:hypothetical protein
MAHACICEAFLSGSLLQLMSERPATTIQLARKSMQSAILAACPYPALHTVEVASASITSNVQMAIMAELLVMGLPVQQSAILLLLIMDNNSVLLCRIETCLPEFYESNQLCFMVKEFSMMFNLMLFLYVGTTRLLWNYFMSDLFYELNIF